MATTAETIVVITDANVLINLLRIGQLPLLGKLDAYRFLVPEEVVGEITDPAQRDVLAAAIAAGHLGQTVVDTMEARHGTVGRVWIADRGMSSAENLAWLRQTGRRYIIGAPKAELHKFAVELAGADGG